MWKPVLLVLSLFCISAYANYAGNFALSFDGINDLLTVPHTYEDYGLTDFWTMEAWIKPSDRQDFHQLNIIGFPWRHPNMNYCAQNNFQCPPGSPLVQLRDSKGAWFPIIGNASRVPYDTWHHIAGTWNNQTLNIYVDGFLDASVNPYNSGYNEGVQCANRACEYGLQIGGYYARQDGSIFSSSYFRGEIDDVRVWKYGRSQREIQLNMNTALTGGEPGLLYYWRFDDPGSTVTKSSAFDLYALLGGGFHEALPTFVPSSAPLLAPPTPGTSGGGSSSGHHTPTVNVETGSGKLVVTGAVISFACFFGGILIGVIAAWKRRSTACGGGRGGYTSTGEDASLIK